MTLRRRLSLFLPALRELGPGQLLLYAWYRLLLRSGYLRQRTPVLKKNFSGYHDLHIPRTDLLSLPDPAELKALLAEQIFQVILQADEVLSGQFSLFGGEPGPLLLSPPAPLQHWTDYELGDGQVEGVDIKLIWEPARFGWVFPLARAYHLTQDERYAAVFWGHTETFLEANPVNLGPNWVSGQEVSLRLMALVFAWQVFHASSHSTPARAANLGEVIAAHAARIPPSLAYARAQNNNHLLTEAAGLVTAGLALPDHPSAGSWLELGWDWLNRALHDQIARDGTYVQHSTNYHRLMLQTALWVNCLGRSYPPEIRKHLAAATRWLLALLDPISGRVPNLGHNDGAYIFPLTVCPYEDYRPVLQASARAFLKDATFPPGAWDEMAAWFGIRPAKKHTNPLTPLRSAPEETPIILENPARTAWAYLRAVRFTSRPAHADQLHLDLWWRGLNLARDAGTYLYNAPSPWENSLVKTRVHNTITIDEFDQMKPAGRFLWLDWAQAEIHPLRTDPDGRLAQVEARHDGYRRLGLIHRRKATFDSDLRFMVEDRLQPVDESFSRRTHSFRLHWLLPDWPWEGLAPDVSQEHILHLKSPLGWIDLRVSLARVEGGVEPDSLLYSQLVRAGALLAGSGPLQPNSGWYSPTYTHKEPALSLSFQWHSGSPVAVVSEWTFPD